MCGMGLIDMSNESKLKWYVVSTLSNWRIINEKKTRVEQNVDGLSAKYVEPSSVCLVHQFFRIVKETHTNTQKKPLKLCIEPEIIWWNWKFWNVHCWMIPDGNRTYVSRLFFVKPFICFFFQMYLDQPNNFQYKLNTRKKTFLFS